MRSKRRLWRSRNESVEVIVKVEVVEGEEEVV